MSKKRTPFDDIMKDIEDLMEKLFDEMDIDSENFTPKVYGFSISQKGDREPEIYEFGNFNSELIDVDDPEPFIDIVESDTQIYIMVELPEAEKDDINIQCNSTKVKLKVREEDKENTYDIELPAQADPTTPTATYNNGILEITLNKNENKTKTIPIN